MDTMLWRGTFGGFARGMASCCVALAVGSGSAMAADLVELFTSQGCSACPPADKVLARLAKDPDTVALTFAVDYWDYLGWRDTYAKPEFTRRQREYAKARFDHAVFTPQVVLNGRDAVIGSREDEIRASLDVMRDNGETPDLAITTRISNDRIVVTLPPRDYDGEASVWIAGYLPPKTVDIASGENRDLAVTYVNVVDRMQVVGLWSGEAMTLELPLADVAPEGTAGLAVIVQAKKDGLPGPIIGATRLALQGGSGS
ncbi:hypothetical protein SAMN05192571_10241 [Pleomorphomonas diazotrophica]|nr:hypothetical protein SAMN05192571_10241 [Pleomorphomonas diazotrophica]